MRRWRRSWASAVAPVCAAFCLAMVPLSNFTDAHSLESAPREEQRAFVWALWARITRPSLADQQPAFESWPSEEDVFAPPPQPARRAGLQGWRGSSAAPDLGAPIITHTYYNEAAYRHIRDQRLYQRVALERLRREGQVDRIGTNYRSIADFPPDAVVVKTAWWPVRGHGMTPVPVWDAQLNPPRPSGNGYLTWARAVSINVDRDTTATANRELAFGTRAIASSAIVALSAFHHVRVDDRLAQRLRADPSAAKAAVIVLGRSIQSGDYLVLVGASIASRAIDNWVWGALWWHDAPSTGEYSAGRPAETPGWRGSFLMNVATDSTRPTTLTGAPHVCFNPWLEGRFPDGGSGGGIESNCVACHRRAAYPATSFLPVTRGDPDLQRDPAFAAGQVRTSFLWTLAQRAQP